MGPHQRASICQGMDGLHWCFQQTVVNLTYLLAHYSEILVTRQLITLLEDYDPSRSAKMSCICPSCIYDAMFGWGVPIRVDPLLLATFHFLHTCVIGPYFKVTLPGPTLWCGCLSLLPSKLAARLLKFNNVTPLRRAAQWVEDNSSSTIIHTFVG